MTTQIGRVRGLGSAHAGAHHWWHQKITAGTNVLLVVWLLASIARLPAYDYTTVRLWLHSMWAAVPMVLLIASVFYHFRLGLQVVIEDYITIKGGRLMALMAMRAAMAIIGLATLWAVSRIAL